MEEKLRATPAARALARKLEVDLSLVTRSGANGRVHKDDVIAFNIEKEPKITPLAKKIAISNNIDYTKMNGSGFRGKILKEDILPLITQTDNLVVVNKESAETKVSNKEEKVLVDTEIIPMTAMRKVISKRMSESYFTAPTFTLNYEIDMTEVKKLRAALLDPILQKTGNKITYTDIIAMAVIKTLEKPEHKYINSSLSDDGQSIIIHNYVNLSMAVGFDEGLLTPVLKDAHKKSISEIVVGLKDLAKGALAMKLKPDEMTGSTFTISNLGMYGVKNFNPIINQPNSAILGISAMVDKPVVINSEIVIRPIMELSLTIDHRVVDGLAGAKFMQDLKGLIENPVTMLI
ncbi:dihydrolipoamide acetyltransferase [Caviibacter abscessus]|uniref:dihydrolipoamide acetyltransferase n=1 Tax=Caviibacter abscessus TaxID=1766719 RepID=UPI0008388CF7|nr:dihydrolipoamide acetyltransferase [Caviibacter abscessus]